MKILDWLKSLGPKKILLIIIVAVVVIGGVVYKVGATRSKNTTIVTTQGNQPNQTKPDSSQTNQNKQEQQVSGLAPCPSATATGCDKTKLLNKTNNGSANCAKTGATQITASPIAIDDIALIQPMGLAIGGHVTPIDHGYFYIKGANAKPPTLAGVYAPIDGKISTAGRQVRTGGIGSAKYDDYALTFEASCTFRVRYSNLVKFAGEFGSKVGQIAENQSVTPDFAIKAGDLIGYTGRPTAYGIDVWVEDDTVTLTGFVNPDQYKNAESWKLHMVDLFERTKEPLKSQLLALVLRDAEPRWGKIDYDIDGKLVGNWFEVGTGGYAGLQKGSEGYWSGHLAIFPDGNDPSQTMISFGKYQTEAKQFMVVNNTPEPAQVGVDTGLVKYELGTIISYSGDTGKPWDRVNYLPHMRNKAGQVETTVLFQLTGKRALKMEVFPGKSASEVSGFSAGAKVYER